MHAFKLFLTYIINEGQLILDKNMPMTAATEEFIAQKKARTVMYPQLTKFMEENYEKLKPLPENHKRTVNRDVLRREYLDYCGEHGVTDEFISKQINSFTAALGSLGYIKRDTNHSHEFFVMRR